jgi:hypothetical protein
VVAAAGSVSPANRESEGATGEISVVAAAMYWGKPADIGAKMEATA